jgi:hypothetical protein
MKKIIAPTIILAIAFSLDSICLLFKIMPWPGVNWIIIITAGLKFIGFIYLAIELIKFYKKIDNHASNQ